MRINACPGGGVYDGRNRIPPGEQREIARACGLPMDNGMDDNDIISSHAGDEDFNFPYQGPRALLGPVTEALISVIDPEVALSIVDVGLIYGVTITDGKADVVMTMTSAACPVTDVIIEDVERELAKALPAGTQIAVELVWEPAWNTDMMSNSAKIFMGW